MPIAQHHQPEPRGILQDAGEVEVMTADSGQVRHRYAMVVAFNSEEDLRQALADHHCAYRDGQAVQERIAHG
ncbi:MULTISPECIES: hypothetical protein [Halomonas]|uniref:Uncharacterized protein n=1 Tax=Halomonas halophila TaxID=29573 RepID=A0ABQ0U8Z8_9GAMM|nr:MULTISPECIES: hypothetical protein [Halomonas]MDR5891134.1 hypothetical protein [Halomonas salina]WJY08402.1 hypothetical protein QWG60_05675 [Halomonas halophila]GEK74203.1 hypothetical protein HHA04nite_27470 [Halomonas halophila]